MAIYRCSIKIISRGKGKSAVAAAAYRAGETITNEYDGIMHDYTRKGSIGHSEILLPNNSPPEYADRVVLWNAVEKIENPLSIFVPPIQTVHGRVVFFRKEQEKISTLKPLTVWIFAVSLRRRKRGTG